MNTREVKKNQLQAENWLSKENIKMALFILKIPATLGSLYCLYNNMPHLRRDMELAEFASKFSGDKGAMAALLLLAMAGDDFSKNASLTMAGLNGYLLMLAVIPFVNIVAMEAKVIEGVIKGVDLSVTEAFTALVSDASKGFIAGGLGWAASSTGMVVKSGLNSAVSFFSGSKSEEKENTLDHKHGLGS